jgi:ribosomal-protein-alanine N-acetyltransferase
MQISNMTVADLDSISDVLLDDFDDFWNYNIFKAELENPNSHYIVAKQNDLIVGFAGIWIAVDEAHVTNIVVKKSNRGCGIGSLLLENLISMVKSLNLKSLTLEVNETNKPAIKLYEKYGFKRVGARKNYYDNKYSAIIMTAKL